MSEIGDLVSLTRSYSVMGGVTLTFAVQKLLLTIEKGQTRVSCPYYSNLMNRYELI